MLSKNEDRCYTLMNLDGSEYWSYLKRQSQKYPSADKLAKAYQRAVASDMQEGCNDYADNARADWDAFKDLLRQRHDPQRSQRIRRAHEALLKVSDYKGDPIDTDELEKLATYRDFSKSIYYADRYRDYVQEHIKETTLKVVKTPHSNYYIPDPNGQPNYLLGGCYSPAVVKVRETYNGDPRTLKKLISSLCDLDDTLMANMGDYLIDVKSHDDTYWVGNEKKIYPEDARDLEHATLQSLISLADVMILDCADDFNEDHNTIVAHN